MKTAIVVLMVASSGAASAIDLGQPSSRTGKWEAGVMLNSVDSWDVNGANGSSIDVDDDTGWGLMLGYNFNEHFNLTAEFTFNQQSYDATVVPVDPAGPAFDIHRNLDNDAVNFNFTYNVLARSITPFFSGGVGWTYLDSNVRNGDISSNCWWDPFWGYVCYPYYSTYSDTSFSYGVDAGVRWDAGRNMVIKASVGRKWLDMDGVHDTPDMLIGKLGLSWMFD